jgi:hypothetical protein
VGHQFQSFAALVRTHSWHFHAEIPLFAEFDSGVIIILGRVSGNFLSFFCYTRREGD